MPPRRKKPSGLTEEDVNRLRSQLAEGRRPRVALSGPQFETGASGSVVRIGDPAADGPDFLTVRVKVNGVTDELAFAPGELSIGSRTRSAGSGGAEARGAGSARGGSPGGRTRTARSSASPVAGIPSAGETPVAGAREADSATPAPPPAPRAAPAANTTPSAPSAAKTTSAANTTSAASTTPSAPSAASGPGSRRRKAPAAPAVTVTISSSGAAWSVSASRGARNIAKNVPVTPGLVTAIADLLDQPAVSEAVAEINETALEQARQRAEQLRAELQDLEAVLATHRAPR